MYKKNYCISKPLEPSQLNPWVENETFVSSYANLLRQIHPTCIRDRPRREAEKNNSNFVLFQVNPQ